VSIELANVKVQTSKSKLGRTIIAILAKLN